MKREKTRKKKWKGVRFKGKVGKEERDKVSKKR